MGFYSDRLLELGIRGKRDTLPSPIRQATAAKEEVVRPVHAWQTLAGSRQIFRHCPIARPVAAAENPRQ
jgi:hypothetical protein